MSARRSSRGAYWLLKTEPEVFSFDDLWRAKGRRTVWSGVRNFQARNRVRDELRPGDGVLVYHSSADPSGVAGIAEVVRGGYPDPNQFDPADPAYDARSTPDAPRWFAVDVAARARLPRFVSLAELRGDRRLAGMELLARGSRLSVQRVSPAHWRAVLAAGGVPEAPPSS